MVFLKQIFIICLLGDPFIPATSVPHSGGFNADSLELLEYMSVQKDWECTVITNKTKYVAEYSQSIGDNITIYRVNIPNECLKNQDLIYEYYPELLKKIEIILNTCKEKPNLIHSFYWLSGKVACDLKNKYSIPFVHSVVSLSFDKIRNGEMPNCSFQFEWEKSFLSSADYIISITDDEQRCLINTYNVNPTKIVIVGRGVHKAFENPIRTPDGISANLPHNILNYIPTVKSANFWNNGAFLYMGRLNKIKGIDYIFKAWYSLYLIYKEAMPPLWIVGGTPNEIADTRIIISNIIEELTYLENTHKIIWWGYLNAEGISTLLLKSLVLVTHSKFEAGGRVIIEAMSSGTPVIATPTGFGADFINDWSNGFLVPYSNVELLAHRMRHFIIQPLLSNTLGNLAKIIYQKIKSEWNCYKKHMAIYNSLVCHDSKLILLKNQNNVLNKTIKYFSSNLLTTYPYRTPSVTTNYIKQQIINNLNMPCDEITEIKYSLWVVSSEDKKYVIKRLLPKLNVATLWQLSPNSSVFLPEISLERLISIGVEYTPCLPIYRYCNVSCLIAMERCQKVSSEIDFENMLNCLARQKKIENISDDLKNIAFTRFSLLNELNNTTKNKTDFLWSEIGNDLQVQLEQKLKQNKNVINYGLCYGKNYLEHTVKKEDVLFLLPSETIFPAEWGYDFAELLTEYYMTFNWNISDFMKSYYKTLEKIRISNNELLTMCLCSLILHVIKYNVLSFTNEKKLIDIIMYLLNLKL